MNKSLWFILIIAGLALQQCRVAREIVRTDSAILPVGMAGMERFAYPRIQSGAF